MAACTVDANLRRRRLPGREPRLFLAGALLGLAVFLLVYGVAPLNAANDAFCRGGYMEKDIQQHYAGWLFYRQSGLAFPLGIAQNVNAPNGLSVVYTDSLPLFAVIFRLMAPLLPETFQYFGLATLLFFSLQGGFAALLVGLFAEGTAVPLIGSALFAASPVLLERAFRHTSLGAQFFVLAALYWYFKGKKQDRYAYPGLFVLNALTVTIHPYFAPMTFAVTLALLAEYAARHRRWLHPLLFLAANLLAAAGVAWCFGYFYGTATSGGQALYGYFGMNLNALWNPAGVNGTDYSLLLPVQNQVGGNFDAFAYLGVGVLLALALVVIEALRGQLHVRARLRGHWMLCVVCLVLTLFAVSNVVTANGATLLTLPLPAVLTKLFSVFRSGGRLFWPVYYLLMLAAVLGVYRFAVRLRRPRFVPLAAVAVLVAVQLCDLGPGLAARHAEMLQAQTQAAYPSALTSDFWQQAAGRYSHLVSLDGIQDDALHLALYAADAGMTTNDPFAARYDETAYQAAAEAALAELAAGQPQADTLYLFRDEGDFLQVADAVQAAAWCGHILGDGCDWYVVAPGMQGSGPAAQAEPYGEAYPLRLADYTDALWNRGVLDADRTVICFKDSPFARQRLEGAAALAANGCEYPVLKIDDTDAGWLMVTLEIEDATVLWDQELETIY